MSRATDAGLDRGVSAVVLKLDVNPFHHGALSIIRSLGRAGVPVYAVVDGRASPAGLSRYLQGRFLWTPEPDDVPTVLKGLREISGRIGGRPVLIPTDDAGAILLAEHAEELAQHFRLPDQPRHLPRELASKLRLAELCAELGVPSPGARPAPSLGALAAEVDRLTFPAVVKITEPWQGGGGLKSTTIVQDATELLDLAARFPGAGGPAVLAQDYLPGDSSEDWFFHGHVGEDDGGAAVFRMSVTGRKVRSYPPTAGITTLGRAWDNPQLRAVAEGFLAAVGYRGIVDLDFRLDRRTGRYHLLDANPRPGAQFAIARRSDGVDAARSLHRELTGRPLVAQEAQSQDHALCVENYDAASAVWSIAHRRLTLSAWRRSLTEGPVELAWFAWDDVLPAAVMWLRFALRLAGRRPARRRHPRPVAAAGRGRRAAPPGEPRPC